MTPGTKQQLLVWIHRCTSLLWGARWQHDGRRHVETGRHTDLHVREGDWIVKPKLPIIPGHEGAGIVAKLGEGVTTLKVGTESAMPGCMTLAVDATTACLVGKLSAVTPIATLKIGGDQFGMSQSLDPSVMMFCIL
mmetsp:Transcript_15351/g.33640  ORF Transcript_15351/g.33640 Transcript_15351/m.33640 type:complete len:136 (-) Transcript_15351:291-698(-)